MQARAQGSGGKTLLAFPRREIPPHLSSRTLKGKKKKKETHLKYDQRATVLLEMHCSRTQKEETGGRQAKGK